MTQDLRPYPEYKPSGLPWLGEVPAHWDVRRNGRLFAQRNETGFGSLPILEVSLKTGVRVRDMENLKRKQVMTDREKYKRADKGDIAYNMMRMWQGAVGAAPVEGLVSPAYVVARPFVGTDTRYFSYLFRTAAYMAEVDGYSRGIVKDRNRLYWQDFKRMPSCYPPPEEQRAIADYLDANAALVRKYIRNRRRLIEVLSEQKQAIINHAVTRGLDPSVQFKESGIAWLGEVPAHWEIQRAKYLLKEIDERSTDGAEQLLRVSQYTGVTPRTNDDRTGMPRAASLVGYKRVYRGDFVVNIMIAWNGSFGASDFEGVVSPAYGVYRFQPGLHAWYYHYLLRTAGYLARIKSASTGVIDSRLRLYSDELGRIEFLVPKLDEQIAIADHVANHTRGLSAAIEHIQREIYLIREYRTRLIADVVTGKLDVRQLAPPPGSLEAEEVTAIDADEFDDELPEEEDSELVE